MSDFLVKLQSYQLFTLQARIYNKLLIFAHGIKTNARSPLELRSLINSAVTPDVQTEENGNKEEEKINEIYPKINFFKFYCFIF